MGKLSKFIRHKGRPYELSAKNGEGVIRIQFYEGYVVLVSRQPGLRYHQEIAITRSAWWALLRNVSKPTALMQGPNFDRNQAEREAYAAEQLLLGEKRARRREEDLEAKRAAQRRRHQRARARARRAQT